MMRNQRLKKERCYAKIPQFSCHTDEFELPWNKLSKIWSWKSPLRTDFTRRQSLLEIDVVVAMALGLTLEELVTIYRVQFPVMQQYERVDEYDQKGRRLPNTARKDPGGTEVRAARERRAEEIAEGKAKENDPLEVSWMVDGGTQEVTKTFYPPYHTVNREQEYEVAWQEFERRLGEKGVR